MLPAIHPLQRKYLVGQRPAGQQKDPAGLRWGKTRCGQLTIIGTRLSHAAEPASR